MQATISGSFTARGPLRRRKGTQPGNRLQLSVARPLHRSSNSTKPAISLGLGADPAKATTGRHQTTESTLITRVTSGSAETAGVSSPRLSRLTKDKMAGVGPVHDSMV